MIFKTDRISLYLLLESLSSLKGPILALINTSRHLEPEIFSQEIEYSFPYKERLTFVSKLLHFYIHTRSIRYECCERMNEKYFAMARVLSLSIRYE
jgi:hypothetical protein